MACTPIRVEDKRQQQKNEGSVQLGIVTGTSAGIQVLETTLLFLFFVSLACHSSLSCDTWTGGSCLAVHFCSWELKGCWSQKCPKQVKKRPNRAFEVQFRCIYPLLINIIKFLYFSCTCTWLDSFTVGKPSPWRACIRTAKLSTNVPDSGLGTLISVCRTVLTEAPP